MTRKQSDQRGLREVPATLRRTDGTAQPAVIVTPDWSAAELIDITEGLHERGWLTRQQADRDIAQIRESARGKGRSR